MTMNPATRLKLCNRILGLTLILMLASGIQLEATSGQYAWIVWPHIVLGILFTALCALHIYLHYRRSNWFARFARNRNTITRILLWTFLLTALTGLAATILWLGTNQHSHLGAIHGKIGFLMVLLSLIHALRHLHKSHRSKQPL